MIRNLNVAPDAGIELTKVQAYGSPLGVTLYVDSADTRASANAKGTKDNPFNSIANALARLATSSGNTVSNSSNATGTVGTLKGDVILVAPSHTETISAAATTWSKSNVRIVGLGGTENGQDRPKITFTTSLAAQLVVSGSKVSIENFYFDGVQQDTLVLAISVTGTDFSFRNNLVNMGSDATHGVARFLELTGTASRALIEGNTFTSTSTWDTLSSAILISGTAASVIIRSNIMIGPFGSAIGGIEGTAAATRIVVDRNLIVNQTGSCTKAMIFHASSTGIITNNRMQILSGTAPITGAAMTWVGGNYYANAVATAGTLI